MSEYQRQCPIDGGTCGQGGTCYVCKNEALGSELAAAKARIAELEAQIKRESDARRKQKVTIDFTRNQLDKAIAEHRQQQAKRIIELEKALEPLADIVTAFDEKYYDHHQTLVLMEAGDARRAAALLKDK